MSRPTLTQARVQQLAAQIVKSGRATRKLDPETRGHICYPALCGVLQALLAGLVLDLAGTAAAEAINKSLDEIHRDEVPA